ncbi:substrate-binding domain-containing protein [Streptomyces beihaiensis]|uniref:Substrate-binding domain-containing protein n=1 Tax=Streptomyces beihaiensis TaxID=2984495 RepID=A0ABT3U024_9ACTN|nr:substrate-binding domain-containing protein [Streptomyces beihaiensis]MCX3062663.1 substrate-binding domain-containing protein [Streptomyces beihaiensis]
MRQHVDQRHAQILELVRSRGSVRVAELADELGVSAVTLRRDIEALAQRGRVNRLHGVVVWPQERPRHSPDSRGRRVGMIVPTTDYYYADVVRGAREVVEARGARLAVALSDYLPGEDETQARRLLAAGADGLLLTPTWEDGTAPHGEGDWVAGLGVPTVLVERTAPHGHPAAALDRVRSDHAYGSAEALRHLASLGHRRIALALRPTPTSPRLRAGCRSAIEALGLEEAPPSSLDENPARGTAERFERTAAYLREAVTEHGVTAALVHTDGDAVAVIPRLREQGVRVPEDLAVVAYDDEIAAVADIPVTAVAPAKRAIGARAAALLLSRLDASNPLGGVRQHLDLLPTLTVRMSCGAHLSS